MDKAIPKELNVPPLYATENQKDVKFFTPDSFWTWYVIEYFMFWASKGF